MSGHIRWIGVRAPAWMQNISDTKREQHDVSDYIRGAILDANIRSMLEIWIRRAIRTYTATKRSYT